MLCEQQPKSSSQDRFVEVTLENERWPAQTNFHFCSNVVLFAAVKRFVGRYSSLSVIRESQIRENTASWQLPLVSSQWQWCTVVSVTLLLVWSFFVECTPFQLPSLCESNSGCPAIFMDPFISVHAEHQNHVTCLCLQSLLNAESVVCRIVRLFTQGSQEVGHFAVDLDCEDAPILPSNWSRTVSYAVSLVNQDHERSIRQGMIPVSTCIHVLKE